MPTLQPVTALLVCLLFVLAAPTYAQPTNDNLCNAQLLTVGQSCNGTTNGDNTGATAQTNEPAGSCYSGFSPTSVWFRFVAPASGLVSITTNLSIGSNSDTEIALFMLPSGNCNDLSDLIEIACAQDDNVPPQIFNSTIDIAPVNPGEIYYLSVSGWGGTTGSFCVEITELPSPSPRPAANDTLCNASPLTLNGGCNASPNGSNAQAFFQPGEPQGSCISTRNSVWYTFVGPTTGFVDLSTQNLVGGTNPNTDIALFTLSGGCNAPYTLNEVACATSGTNGGSRLDTIPVVAGTTYYVAVSGGTGGTFCLTANSVVGPTGPVNDSLCNALPISVDVPCTTAAYTNMGASQEAGEPLGSCFLNASKSVWFSFVGPPSGAVQISTDIDSPGVSLTDTEIAVYTLNGSCRDLNNLTEVGCDQDGGTTINFNSVITGLTTTPGQTYYVQVMGYNGTTGNFCLEVSSFFRPPNDNVCAATYVPTDGTVYSFNNIGASVEAGATGVINPPAGDGSSNQAWFEAGLDATVWHTFVVPASGSVQVDLCSNGAANTDFDTQLAIYTVGDCQDYSTFSLLGANDDADCSGPGGNFVSRLSLDCLSPGDTLYALVDGWNGEEGNYGISFIPLPATDPLAAISALQLPPQCIGQANGIISVQANGGGGAYRYNWNTGDSSAILTNLNSGTYQLTLTDQCDSVVSTTIDLVNTPLTLDAGQSDTLCQSIDLLLGGEPTVSGGSNRARRRAFGIGITSGNRDMIRFATQQVDDSVFVNTGFANVFAADFGLGDPLYALENDNQELIAIDTALGVFTPVGKSIPDPFHTWSGLAFNAADSTWYAVSTDGTESSLYTVDPDSGTTTKIGFLPLDRPLWLAINPQGEAYVLEGLEDKLYKVNVPDTTVQEIGEVGFNANNAQDADFDPLTGYLHLAAFNQTTQLAEYRVIDLNAGPFATLLDTLTIGEIGAFAISAETIPYRIKWTGNGSLSDSTSPNPSFASNTTVNELYEFVLEATDACGSTETDTVRYLVSGGILQINFDSNILGGNAIVKAVPQGGIPPFTYLWSTGSTQDTVHVAENQMVSVTITDAAGCERQAETQVTTHRDFSQAFGNWQIFPNPVVDQVFVLVEVPTTHLTRIRLQDATGRTLKESWIQAGFSGQQQIDVQDLAAGVYTLHLETEYSHTSYRVIKP